MPETFIRETRRRAGMSVPELARATGVSETAAWNWDRGESVPREKFIGVIAQTLNVEADELRAKLVRIAGGDTAARQAPIDRVMERARTQIAKTLKIDRGRVQLKLMVVDLGSPFVPEAMEEPENPHAAKD